MKKVAYISSPHFADCDVPLLHHLQQTTHLIYILRLNNANKRMTLCRVPQIKRQGGVFPASEYEGLERIVQYVNSGNTYILNMPGTKDLSPANLMAIVRLLLFLIRQKVDVIHLTWPLRYGEFLVYLLRRRMILTLHDPFTHSSELHWHNRLHRWAAFRFIKRFILLNRSQRDEFISYYKMQKAHVYDSRLSIFTHLHDTQPVLPQLSDYVLFFGSISSHKGVEYLCQAMQKIHEQYPAAHLVVAGSGEMYFDIEPYVQQGIVTLVNHYLTDEELAGYIHQARFAVCPYTDATQSGVVMSAFALATPVIATNVGGLPEMVADGHHGLIVPPKDAEALAKAIKRLLSDELLLKQMSDNIKTDYLAGERSWEHIAQEITNIYEKEF